MVRIGMLAALVLIAVGCGGGDPCAGSRCPADDRPTASEYDRCVQQHRSNQNNRCYQQLVNYELCVQANQVCNRDGKTDGQATGSQTNANCRQAADSLLCCSLGLTTCR